MNRKPTPSILDDVLSATPTTVKLSIEQIKIDGGTQMRAGLHEPTVLEYLEAMQPVGWSQFPSIVVYHDGSDYWLADGFHRLEAFRRAAAQVDQPADRIPADVRAGTRRDAILYAAGANAQHGLRRTNADKRRAVETLLRDDEWRQWSDREIARRCEVDNSFVSRVRRELSVDKPQIAERTVQRNGTTYTQNTANIGATRTYASGLPALDVPLQPGSPEAKRLTKEIKAATWADRRIDPTYPEPPTKSQISGCVDTLAWEAALGSDEKRLAHMSAPENFQYYLDGVRQRLDFPINHYSVKDALAAHIERLRNTLAVVPEPKTITEPTDGKVQRMGVLIASYRNTISTFDEYGELTGHHVETLPAKRELEKLIALLERECALSKQIDERMGE